MVSQGRTSIDMMLWHQLVEAYQTFQAAQKGFSRASNTLELIRNGLNKPAERSVALQLVTLLDTEQQQQLFDDLLVLSANTDSNADSARQIVLSLPHEWLLSTIESRVDRLLQRAGEKEYRGILELYKALDRNLMTKLARRALLHSDVAVKQAGADFIQLTEKVLEH